MYTTPSGGEGLTKEHNRLTTQLTLFTTTTSSKTILLWFERIIGDFIGEWVQELSLSIVWGQLFWYTLKSHIAWKSKKKVVYIQHSDSSTK
jgi:hypothetical protein